MQVSRLPKKTADEGVLNSFSAALPQKIYYMRKV